MSEPYVGEIRMVAFAKAPTNWVICDGRLLSVQTYQLLFSLIGTTYGGDGVSTFGIPYLSGCAPVGMGTGTSLTPRSLGQTFGSDAGTVAEANMPAHTHAFNALTATATSATPGPTQQIAAPSFLAFATPGTVTASAMGPNIMSPMGANAAHNNYMPSFGVFFMIATNGLYPTRN